jgi:Tfp pilus assembly protein PilX
MTYPDAQSSTRLGQRGASLVVGLIMLVLITVLITSAYTLSSVNLKAVGNMQTRDEAIAAANSAIETVLSSNFTAAPTAESINVDIDNNGTIDYRVDFDTPVCIGDSQLPNTAIPPSSISLGEAFNIAVAKFYQTLWELDARVTHVATGTSVRVRQGVRVLHSESQYNAVCPSV